MHGALAAMLTLLPNALQNPPTQSIHTTHFLVQLTSPRVARSWG